MITGLVIGLIFAPLAAAMAVLITHDEYEHHRLARGQLIRFYLETAVVVYLVFLALSIAIGLLVEQK